jgi:hypothetical protein
VNATPFDTLLFQEYEVAPEPESVTAVPAQTVWSAPALTVGNELTVTTSAVLVAEQPLDPVTATVYEPAAVAVYVAPVPTVDNPLLQEYDIPSLADKTTLKPLQNVVSVAAVIVAVGRALTYTVVVTGLLVHPYKLVYEYVIVVDPYIPGLIAVTTPLEGLMLATLVFEEDHVPPEVELDNAAVEPAQIDIGAEISESIVG